jgi:D-lyxose ketol-isomerase
MSRDGFDKIALQPFIKSAKFVEKVWGAEAWLTNTEKYCAKILKLNPGFQCSLHYHNFKDETFIVMQGDVYLEIRRILSAQPLYHHFNSGDQQRVYPGTAHRFWTNNPDGALILEISTYHDDEDVVRLQESSRISNEQTPNSKAP